MNQRRQADKLVENEAMFRQQNETVQEGIKELNEIANAQNEEEAIPDTTVLKFYCECSDENCTLRVSLSVKQYEQIHADRRQFIVAPGHEIVSIEEVVDQLADHTIVKKLIQAPEQPDTLHETPVSNV